MESEGISKSRENEDGYQDNDDSDYCVADTIDSGLYFIVLST